MTRSMLSSAAVISSSQCFTYNVQCLLCLTTILSTYVMIYIHWHTPTDFNDGNHFWLHVKVSTEWGSLREVEQEAVHKNSNVGQRVIHQYGSVSNITLHRWMRSSLLTFKTYIPPYQTRLTVGLCGEDIDTYFMLAIMNPVLVAKCLFTTPQQNHQTSWRENGSNPYRKKERGKKCVYILFPKRVIELEQSSSSNESQVGFLPSSVSNTAPLWCYITALQVSSDAECVKWPQTEQSRAAMGGNKCPFLDIPGPLLGSGQTQGGRVARKHIRATVDLPLDRRLMGTQWEKISSHLAFIYESTYREAQQQGSSRHTWVDDKRQN